VKQLLVVCGVLALAACTKVEGTSTTRGARKVAEPSRPSGIEKLVLDLEACSLEGYQITATCPAMETLAAELRQPGTAHEISVALGRKLLAHHAPAVRIEAATLLAVDAPSRDAIVDAARYETDVHVREAMIRVIASDGARFPRVGEFLLESTQFPVSGIRAQALDALTRPASRALPGAAVRVLAMAERDPDPALRRAACASGGKLGDPVFLPFYERVTSSADDPELYAACLEGVVAMFHNEPAFDTASEGAYHLFLRRIEAQPAKAPWQVMSAFCNDNPEASAHRAPWFDAHEVTSALRAVVAERAASWQARSAAIESMVGLGASKTELTALAQGYTARDGSDKVVLDKLLAESDRL
jgi:hypothetical protein